LRDFHIGLRQRIPHFLPDAIELHLQLLIHLRLLGHGIFRRFLHSRKSTLERGKFILPGLDIRRRLRERSLHRVDPVIVVFQPLLALAGIIICLLQLGRQTARPGLKGLDHSLGSLLLLRCCVRLGRFYFRQLGRHCL